MKSLGGKKLLVSFVCEVNCIAWKICKFDSFLFLRFFLSAFLWSVRIHIKDIFFGCHKNLV